MIQVLVYCDKGAGPRSVREMVRTLRFLEPTAKIKLVKASHFLNEEWEQECDILVFPGGRDLPYVEALSGLACNRIHDYVLQGGKYFGICAGAYFASSFIEFEKGGSYEVCGHRELKFFPGKAVGPLFERNVFRYDSFDGACAAPIEWNKQTFSLFYHGGCTFEKVEQYPDVEVIARYASLPQNPAAMILSKVGRGKALLSGVHPEYCPSNCKKLSFYPQLVQGHSFRLKLLNNLWKDLLFSSCI
jgi:glutamine amidotransferase-like uncharacterized protein